MMKKLGSQTLKDYVLFPLLTGPSAPLTFVGNATANLVRNLWTFSIIFCGHFPEGVATFTQEEADDESRGGWYLRQLLGSANIEGGSLFHLMTGNLSHQIEHHLFPDIPAHRYPEMAVEVRQICERYGLSYNTGGFAKQFGSVVAKICKLALPWTRSSDLDDGPDAGRGPKVVEGGVDVGQRSGAGDQALQVQLSGLGERDEAGDVPQRVAAA